MRALLLLTLLAAGPLAWADEAAAPADWRAAARRSADAGVAFLLADQNPNGSWGGPRGSTYTIGAVNELPDCDQGTGDYVHDFPNTAAGGAGS